MKLTALDAPPQSPWKSPSAIPVSVMTHALLVATPRLLSELLIAACGGKFDII